MTINELANKIINTVIFMVCFWAIAAIISLVGGIISVYCYYNDEIDNAIWWFNLHLHVSGAVVVIGVIVMLWKLMEIKKLSKENSG